MNTMNPVIMALMAGLFTWGMTVIGAAGVFMTKNISRPMLDFMLAFAGGVMTAASFWSLLSPAIEMSGGSWVPAVVGFAGGGIFLRIVDKILPHLHIEYPMSEAEGPKTKLSRTMLLVFAITLHNIPEGLAVGVAFGALASGMHEVTMSGAIALAIGIGIQNLPEGMAVAVPLRREGLSRLKSFWYGQLSGFVEPVAAVIGAAAVMVIQPILPYALAFAAGAMIFVVVEEVVPESQKDGNTDIATAGFMVGFTVMMFLDVALG